MLDNIIQRLRSGKVLIDDGCALNILFAGALTELGLRKKDLTPVNSPLWRIVLGRASQPLGEITLPVEFGTIDNFCTEYVNFLVADFDKAYHAILGRPALTKFMAMPHYSYLVLKMPAPRGVLSL